MRTKERRFVSLEKREVMLQEMKALAQQNFVPSCFVEKGACAVRWLPKWDVTF